MVLRMPPSRFWQEHRHMMTIVKGSPKFLRNTPVNCLFSSLLSPRSSLLSPLSLIASEDYQYVLQASEHNSGHPTPQAAKYQKTNVTRRGNDPKLRISKKLSEAFLQQAHTGRLASLWTSVHCDTRFMALPFVYVPTNQEPSNQPGTHQPNQPSNKHQTKPRTRANEPKPKPRTRANEPKPKPITRANEPNQSK